MAKTESLPPPVDGSRTTISSPPAPEATTSSVISQRNAQGYQGSPAGTEYQAGAADESSEIQTNQKMEEQETSSRQSLARLAHDEAKDETPGEEKNHPGIIKYAGTTPPVQCTKRAVAVAGHPSVPGSNRQAVQKAGCPRGMVSITITQ